ncbi:MAG: VOC family protein [Acidobacteriota bacterium]|nr:VOC family protein [Acidobacteriota bacterium]
MAKRKPARSASAKKSAKAKKSPARSKPAPRKSGGGSGALALRSASPSFTVGDLETSLAFYRDVLGFEVEETWKDDEGRVMGVSLKAGDVSFMIGQDDWKKGRDRKKGEGFRIYCETKKRVDDLAKRIEARGGRLDQGPTDEPWGVRDISLTDPDGFKITIAGPKR